MDERLKIEIRSRMRRPSIFIAMAACLIGSSLFLLTVNRIEPYPPPYGRFYIMPLFIGVTGILSGIAGILGGKIWWQPIPSPVDLGICRSCGYNMRGHNRDSACPECGCSPNRDDRDWRIMVVRILPAIVLWPWGGLGILLGTGYLLAWIVPYFA